MDSNTQHREVLRLPDLLVLSKGFTLGLNPYHDRAAAETRAWLVSHNALDSHTLAIFTKADMEQLAARCYPTAPYHEFRTVCDFMTLLVVLDEISDAQNGADAHKTGVSFINVLKDATWDDGTKIASLTRELLGRMGDWVKTGSFKRFATRCEAYYQATTTEAGLRERGEVLKLEAYEHLRRENSAVRACLAIMEFALGLDIPDHVYDNEHFSAVYWAVVDMVCWVSDDIYSYAVERATGLAGNNFVTVLMKNKGLSLQQASDYIGEHYKSLVDQYFSARAALRTQSFGDAQMDQDVERYINEMSNWAIGNVVWSFETKRYFGDSDFKEIKRTQCVPLSPLPIPLRMHSRN
ncbi:terpenoid synthase [Auricularia subglabra TFB-10046 SS5]|nr:terpenoid synthase [Auricularia subglabra TFB-10046 SS5]